MFQLAETAPLQIVGIGTVEAETQLVPSSMTEPAEIEQIRSAGGKGEVLGHFFDAEGRVLEITLTSCTLVVSFGDGRADRIIGGERKHEAISVVLRSGRRERFQAPWLVPIAIISPPNSPSTKTPAA